MRESVANALVDSPVREWILYLLSNVPGFPPIVQTVHILGIGVVVGTIVMVDLRFLGLAVPTQNVSEMIDRLLPWTWWALASNAVTGGVFVVARPFRYLFNPVFGYKFAFMVPAVALALVVYRLSRREGGYWERSAERLWTGRVIAAASLLLWVGVVLAGRWIAYSDYLFFPE